MANTITWNGVSSSTLGLTVERYPNMNRPSRKYQTANISGQNGSAYILENSWNEVVQTYEIFAKTPVSSFKAIAEWLNGADGYAVLTDSYDPTVYRRAVFVDYMDVEDIMNRYGRATIQFRCRPERFMVTEDITKQGTSLPPINNPTNHTALPLIKVNGRGYPSMLPLTDRQAVSTTYTEELAVQGLTPQKIRYNFIGLSVAQGPFADWYVSGDPSKLTSYTINSTTVSITPTAAGWGVAMNRSVQPNEAYTVSFRVTSASVGNALLKVMLCDRYGTVAKVVSAEAVRGATKSVKFETTPDTYWAVVLFAGAENKSVVYDNIMFNQGTTVLPYAPYSEDTASSFRVGDTIVNLSELADYLYIDCETMNAYRGNGENCNPIVTLTDIYGNMTPNVPRLVSGNNEIVITDAGTNNTWIESLVFTPRFWTL